MSDIKHFEPLPKSVTIKASKITPLGGFVNHSYSPNADILQGKKRVLITTKEIKAGDEITIDYTPWYDPEALKTYK